MATIVNLTAHPMTLSLAGGVPGVFVASGASVEVNAEHLTPEIRRYVARGALALSGDVVPTIATSHARKRTSRRGG